jgi:hypothetical protein
MEDEVGSSCIPKSLNSGNTKVPAFKLTLDIEQWTYLKKVFEEREDTTTYALCRQWEVSVEEK